jgi:hypothetical protein
MRKSSTNAGGYAALNFKTAQGGLTLNVDAETSLLP